MRLPLRWSFGWGRVGLNSFLILLYVVFTLCLTIHSFIGALRLRSE